MLSGLKLSGRGLACDIVGNKEFGPIKLADPENRNLICAPPRSALEASSLAPGLGRFNRRFNRQRLVVWNWIFLEFRGFALHLNRVGEYS